MPDLALSHLVTMKPYGNTPHPFGSLCCSECGRPFRAYREQIFGQKAQVCSSECQRARKTRLQRERRDARARSRCLKG